MRCRLLSYRDRTRHVSICEEKHKSEESAVNNLLRLSALQLHAPRSQGRTQVRVHFRSVHGHPAMMQPSHRTKDVLMRTRRGRGVRADTGVDVEMVLVETTGCEVDVKSIRPSQSTLHKRMQHITREVFFLIVTKKTCLLTVFGILVDCFLLCVCARACLCAYRVNVEPVHISYSPAADPGMGRRRREELGEGESSGRS